MDGFHGSAVPDGETRAECIEVDPDEQTCLRHSQGKQKCEVLFRADEQTFRLPTAAEPSV